MVLSRYGGSRKEKRIVTIIRLDAALPVEVLDDHAVEPFTNRLNPVNEAVSRSPRATRRQNGFHVAAEAELVPRIKNRARSAGCL